MGPTTAHVEYWPILGQFSRGLTARPCTCPCPLVQPRTDDSDFPQSEVLRRITATLDEALQARDVQKLQFTLVSGLLKVAYSLVTQARLALGLGLVKELRGVWRQG